MKEHDVSVRPVVQAEHDGQPDGQRRGPAEQDDDVGGCVVVSMLRVHNWGGYSKKSERRNINMIILKILCCQDLSKLMATKLNIEEVLQTTSMAR